MASVRSRTFSASSTLDNAAGAETSGQVDLSDRMHLLQQSLSRSPRDDGPAEPANVGQDAEAGLAEAATATDPDIDPDGTDPAAPGGLSTFVGVFGPVSLCMFSTLLFLRVGFIVGNAGLIYSLLQLALAYSILLLTAASVSAIATNGVVENGGIYYMISRTLGPEIGGSIGVLFYAANTVASALFATGCAEGIINNFGDHGLVKAIFHYKGDYFQFFWSSCVNGVNLLIGVFGAWVFGKTTLFFFGCVLVCTICVMGSFIAMPAQYQVFNETWCIEPDNCTYTLYDGNFTGLIDHGWPGFGRGGFLQDNLWGNFSNDCEDSDAEVQFFSVFAVLFSGVTGILAGANLSGDLKNPSKSIPRGTFYACGFTCGTYALLFIFTALTCSRDLLLFDCDYMSLLIFWKPVVAFGTIVTTFCASTSALLGASRVLQKLAEDAMFGPLLQFIVKGTIWSQPMAATLVTFVFVELVLLIGSLNTISQICSVLFLFAYLAINISCFSLEWASAPNFRPTFNHFNLYSCALGIISTAVVMLLISWIYTIVTIVACGVLFVGLFWYQPVDGRNWGSVSQAILFHQVRKYLLLLDPRKLHVKFWRPQILLLVKNPRNSCGAIDFCNALKKGGLYVLGNVSTNSDLDELERDPTVEGTRRWLSLINHLNVKAFAELTVASTVRQGIQHLVRLSGIGAFKANTVVIGFPAVPSNHVEQPYDDLGPDTMYSSPTLAEEFASMANEHADSLDAVEYLNILHDLIKLDRNLCIHRNFQQLDYDRWFPRNRIGVRRYSNLVHLDVWLVDFFAKPNAVIDDTGCLFLLQMACVIKMVRKWQHLTVRVMTRVPPRERDDDQSRSSSNTEANSQLRHDALHQRLEQLLKQIRLPAKVTTVELNPPDSEIPQLVDPISLSGLPRDAATAMAAAATTEDEDGGRGSERTVHFEEVPMQQDAGAGLGDEQETQKYQINTISDQFMSFMNNAVREKSDRTAVCLFYLARPPFDAAEDEKARYLQLLEILCRDAPPTLLIHGINPVISTTL